jgi:cation diffusion facilitator family transporter
VPAERSHISIYGALISNLLISVTKFLAAGFTSSASMLAEAIHSIVDTVNELLVLYGLKRSKKEPDQSHPFGYGKEIYFWSFIVSLLIFGLGAGVSIYQGITHIIHPEKLHNLGWNYAVLAASFVFEGSSLYIAMREFNKTRDGLSLWKAIVKSKDPTSFLVIFEDGAAVIGLTIVFVFMVLNHAFNLPWLDGAASVLIGLLLLFVSYILARESSSLLLGEGISVDTQKKIKSMAENHDQVSKVTSILSTYQSPDNVLLIIVIDFKPALDTGAITSVIEVIRKEIKTTFPLVHYVLIQPQTSDLRFKNDHVGTETSISL